MKLPYEMKLEIFTNNPNYSTFYSIPEEYRYIAVDYLKNIKNYINGYPYSLLESDINQIHFLYEFGVFDELLSEFKYPILVFSANTSLSTINQNICDLYKNKEKFKKNTMKKTVKNILKSKNIDLYIVESCSDQNISFYIKTDDYYFCIILEDDKWDEFLEYFNYLIGNSKKLKNLKILDSFRETELSYLKNKPPNLKSLNLNYVYNLNPDYINNLDIFILPDTSIVDFMDYNVLYNVKKVRFLDESEELNEDKFKKIFPNSTYDIIDM